MSADEPTAIETAWRDYLRHCEGYSSVEAATRAAFYSGAAAMVTALLHHGEIKECEHWRLVSTASHLLGHDREGIVFRSDGVPVEPAGPIRRLWSLRYRRRR